MCRLNFSLDNDNRPYIEPISVDSINSDVNPPLFSNQYRYALGQIDYYLSALEPKNDVRFSVDHTNNVFAFLGERGSGKTSCMMSLAKHLTDSKQRSEWGQEYPYVSKQGFEFVQIIDPSFFDDHHNLLALFIAQLYRAFQESVERDEDKQKDIIRRQLVSKFCSAQKHMKQMLDRDILKSDDHLEQLTALSAATQLREDIRFLVDAYLEYKEKKDCQLLVCIDDIDLNAKQASQMAEEIRKYFVHPNMIVFLALKLDQLECIKRKDFKDTFGDHTDNEEIEEMVERYLAKLIPHSQRIYMPDTEVIFGESVCLTSKDFTIEQQNDYKFQTVRQAIPQLIFWKTRYLFYNSEKYTSYIVPRNLRELRQLFSLLAKMQNYRDEETVSPINLYNKRLFKKYLYDNWTINNLSQDNRRRVEAVILVEDNIYFNSIVLKVLKDTFVLTSKNSGENRVEIDRVLDSKIQPCNISMGDIIGLITILERQYVEQEQRKFLFILKTICSIRMYESYDDVTEPTKNDAVKKNEIFFDKLYKDINSYCLLTNGGIFNNDLIGMFINTGRTTPLSGTIATSDLAALMKECIEKWDDAIDDGRVQLVEIIMLCAARTYDLKLDYRESPIPLYASSIAAGDILFDPALFFFNVTRIKECYTRFKDLKYEGVVVGSTFLKSLYEKESDALETTMIGQFRRETLIVRQKVRPEDIDDNLTSYCPDRWLSLCSFRNAEIIQDFSNYLTREIVDKCEDDALIIRYFEVASSYKVKTYDKKQNGEPYDINYSYSRFVSEVLSKGAIKEKFKKIYNPKKSENEDDIDEAKIIAPKTQV